MRAWRVNADFTRELLDLPIPEPAESGVVVRMQSAPVLSYLREVIEGSLGYLLPPAPFTPGTNGIGVVQSVGSGVRHLMPGQRVLLDPRFVVDERVREPAQILIGLTATRSSIGGIADVTKALQQDWREGTFAEYAHMPASVLTPMPHALDAVPDERLVGLSKFAVPYGGLIRAQLSAGETVVVNGASGYFGSAGVLVALAMGASRVVAAGRDQAALTAVAAAGGRRVVPVALAGDVEADSTAIIDAAGGRADVGLDLVGRASSAASTESTLRALRRGGRLVMMGSSSEPLQLGFYDMLANDWHVIGCFMYPKDAPARLALLVEGGLLDLGAVHVRTFALPELEQALDAAAGMRGLELTALLMT
jgi:alcohol dehydrogenase